MAGDSGAKKGDGLGYEGEGKTAVSLPHPRISFCLSHDGKPIDAAAKACGSGVPVKSVAARGGRPQS